MSPNTSTASASPWPDDDPDAPLRMLFSLRGRISRRSFWLWGVAGLCGLGFVLHGLLAIAQVRPGLAEHVVNVLLLWPAVAISAKRWHDRGKSTWWVLIALIPIVGVVWMLIDNGFVRGSPGANAYGPAPSR